MAFLSNIFLPSTTPSLSAVVFPRPTKTYILVSPKAKLIPGRMDFAPSKNAMNLTAYQQNVGVVLPMSECPNEIFLDVRLTTYRQPRQPPAMVDDRFLTNCPKPGWVRLHGVWIAYIDSSGKIISIRRFFGPQTPNFRELIKQEKLVISEQLSEEQIRHMEMFWFDNKNSKLNYIASQGLKHGSLCLGQPLKDYYKIAYDLTSPYFNGGEKDIRNVFRKHGMELGKYYNGIQVRDFLKREYGCYPALSFKSEDGHSVFDDISFLYAIKNHAVPNQLPKLIEHPNYGNVPTGDFLFRSNEFTY